MSKSISKIAKYLYLYLTKLDKFMASLVLEQIIIIFITLFHRGIKLKGMFDSLL